MRTRMIAATLVALASTALAACSSSDSSSPEADFNDADVSFAQDMIPHHRQATQMAALAASRTDNREVMDLASGIEAAQEPEIKKMSDWLQSWGEDVPDEEGSMAGMDHSNMNGDDASSMPGMMSQDELTELEGSSGPEFDRLFLTMMVKHHEGAVEMAKTEQANGQNSAATALATKIEQDQTAEITRMRKLLGS